MKATTLILALCCGCSGPAFTTLGEYGELPNDSETGTEVDFEGPFVDDTDPAGAEYGEISGIDPRDETEESDASETPVSPEGSDETEIDDSEARDSGAEIPCELGEADKADYRIVHEECPAERPYCQRTGVCGDDPFEPPQCTKPGYEFHDVNGFHCTGSCTPWLACSSR